MAKKLLVADDSLTIQKVIRLALSGAGAGNGEGYEIQTVSDGNDAIQQISLFRPDVVLIDVSLPGKTAFEVKRAINVHSDLERVRFVLMSSAFEKVDEDQVKEVVFHARLTKPFDPAHLRDILSQVLSNLPKAGAPKSKSPPPIPTESASSLAPPMTFPGTPPSHLSGHLKESTFGGSHASEPILGTGFREAPLAPPTPPPAPTFTPPPLSPDYNEISQPHMPNLQSYNDAENDIRQLTQSTMQMSGFEDLLPPAPPRFPSAGPGSAPKEDFNDLEMPSEGGFELSQGPISDISAAQNPLPEPPHSFSIEMESEFDWNVQENALKPPPLVDSGNATFPGAPPSDSNRDRTGFTMNPATTRKLESIDLPLSPPPSENLPPVQDYIPLIERNETPPPPFAPSSSAGAPSLKPAFSADVQEKAATAIAMPNFDEIEKRLEDFVRQEISRAIRELTHQELASVTERIVKEEIHKLLSETP